MPFYPLPLSYKVGSCYNNLEGTVKIISTPIIGVSIGICFFVDIISLPIRWTCHEFINIYSDLDESVWEFN